MQVERLMLVYDRIDIPGDAICVVVETEWFEAAKHELERMAQHLGAGAPTANEAALLFSSERSAHGPCRRVAYNNFVWAMEVARLRASGDGGKGLFDEETEQ